MSWCARMNLRLGKRFWIISLTVTGKKNKVFFQEPCCESGRTENVPPWLTAQFSEPIEYVRYISGCRNPTVHPVRAVLPWQPRVPGGSASEGKLQGRARGNRHGFGRVYPSKQWERAQRRGEHMCLTLLWHAVSLERMGMSESRESGQIPNIWGNQKTHLRHIAGAGSSL